MRVYGHFVQLMMTVHRRCAGLHLISRPTSPLGAQTGANITTCIALGFGACKGQLHHLENSMALQDSQRLFFWAGCGLQAANWTALPFYFSPVQRISQILLEYHTILTKARREGIILSPTLNTGVVCVNDHQTNILISYIVKGRLSTTEDVSSVLKFLKLRVFFVHANKKTKQKKRCTSWTRRTKDEKACSISGDASQFERIMDGSADLKLQLMHMFKTLCSSGTLYK